LGTTQSITLDRISISSVIGVFLRLLGGSYDVLVNQLFGVQTGMGMGVLRFDWSQIDWIGSPLMGEFLVSLPYCGLHVSLF
jgi:hypothetical protein